MRVTLVAAACLGLACQASEPPSGTPPAPPSGEAEAAPSGQWRDPWRDAEERGIDFRAVGQEPGWYVEIDEGRSLRLVYDYGAREAATAVGRATTERGTTTYRSTTGTPAVTVAIADRTCSDAMSGQPFPSTVTVTVDDRSLHGCGRALGGSDAWQASARQVGPIRIGMTIAEAEVALGATFDASVDSGECVYRRTSAGPRGVLFMQVAGRIARIDVTAFDVRTDKGIGVGSSEMQVQNAYGQVVGTTPHKYTSGRYLTVPVDDHKVVFETDGQWVTRYRIGRLPEVEWVEGCS